MKIHDQEISIENLVKEMNPRANLHTSNQNGIYLSANETEILEKYNFSIQKYSNIQSLIFDIEEYLNENYDQELDDLENVANTLAELNYYQNTNQ